MRINEKTRARFDAKVIQIAGPSACWPWIAGLYLNGYGQFNFARKTVGAHRMAWMLAHGKIRKGLEVLHKCDNKRCCNPRHLFLGTQADNMADMIKKGREGFRKNKARGEGVGIAKLTAASVAEMRSIYAAGDVTQEQLADRFGVGQSAVSAILRRATWAHVP